MTGVPRKPQQSLRSTGTKYEVGFLSLLGIGWLGRAEHNKRNRYGRPDANTKTCPDSNANANVIHRYTDTCTKYDADEYAQRQSSYAPA